MIGLGSIPLRLVFVGRPWFFTFVLGLDRPRTSSHNFDILSILTLLGSDRVVIKFDEIRQIFYHYFSIVFNLFQEIFVPGHKGYHAAKAP